MQCRKFKQLYNPVNGTQCTAAISEVKTLLVTWCDVGSLSDHIFVAHSSIYLFLASIVRHEFMHETI